MKKYINLLFLLFALSICNANTIKTPYYKVVTAEQRQVVNLVIKSKTKVDNPFIVNFSAVFTCPENTAMVMSINERLIAEGISNRVEIGNLMYGMYLINVGLIFVKIVKE